MTGITQAYLLGAAKAQEDFSKLAWAWVGKAVQNPMTSGAVMGGLTGAMAGGQDNRLYGALAGATLGAFGGRTGVRGARTNAGFHGPAMKPVPQPQGLTNLQMQNLPILSGGLAAGGVTGGLAGGAAMNMIGLGDRPQSMYQRYYG